MTAEAEVGRVEEGTLSRGAEGAIEARGERVLKGLGWEQKSVNGISKVTVLAPQEVAQEEYPSKGGAKLEENNRFSVRRNQRVPYSGIKGITKRQKGWCRRGAKGEDDPRMSFSVRQSRNAAGQGRVEPVEVERVPWIESGSHGRDTAWPQKRVGAARDKGQAAGWRKRRGKKEDVVVVVVVVVVVGGGGGGGGGDYGDGKVKL
ncbi:hypothetical protein KM043_005988 [Ampulex compressa]|nr:hypothetical protein KM043_005988 [Ampulex compressa]